MKAGGINSLLVSAFVVLLPLVLTLWFREKALAAPAEARSAVWFWSFRFLRSLTLGSIALWWMATDLVGLKAAARQYWLEQAPEWIPASQALFLFCFWIPPMTVLVSCQALFQPVYARIREVHWTRGELARQAVFQLGTSLVPVLFAVGGVLELTSGGGFADFALCYLLALLVALGSARALRRHLELTPAALTTGELRDRAFSLAARLGVKLEQIYLLPPGKSRLANAFARYGNSILLTEILLDNLNKREVDAVIGHELVHLQKDHPRLLGFALLGGLAAIMTPYLLLAPAPAWQPLFDILFLAVPLGSFYFVSRRFEYAADSGALKLTGDPVAMITGLAKLHHLNLMPLEWSKWSEKAMTHPSTVRRARAIGRAAGMSEERVGELLDAPYSPAASPVEEHYTAPGSSLTSKVFSSEFKRQASARALLAFSGLAVVLPALLLRALSGLNWPGQGSERFAAGLLLCLVASAVFVLRVPFLGYRGLCRRLRAKLAAAGVPVDEREALLVGLAPGARPRVFEANYSWDIGCLLPAGDSLCYWGEETRFAVRREQIVSLEPGPGMPGWLPTRFLYVRWRAAEGEPENTFNLRPIEVSSLVAMRRAFAVLHKRLSSWHAGRDVSEPAAREAVPLPPPPAAEVTSAPPSAARDPRQILAMVVFAAFASGAVARLLGLPLEWLAPMFPGEATGGYASVSGWYAILISLAMVAFRLAPVWFQREPAPPRPVPGGNTRPV